MSNQGPPESPDEDVDTTDVGPGDVEGGDGLDPDVRKDPMHPDPPEDSGGSGGHSDDDSAVDPYRDSPGAALDDTTGEPPPEPNEPG